ncbi:MAG TPA: signal recognition particle-docking protein FtsY [Candidatus Dormibacteraeota bacterium]|nr:signal recognition particle-docking protein FtsY [Candidatus Dormibacteraeota bacterium]
MQGQEHLVALAAAGAALLLLLIIVLVVRRRRRRVGVAPRASWTSGLAKTRGSLTRRLFDAWGSGNDLDGWLLQVEEILLSSDVGIKATQALLARLGAAGREARDAAQMRAAARDAVRDLLAAPEQSAPAASPEVIVVVGVNGVGKTTTIGKLAHLLGQEGRKVVLVAGDTFRAAAIEQLSAWAERVGADIVKHQHGADPSAVTYDGVQAALARHADVVIVDTAGRLHVKANLMEEVKKIARTTAKLVPDAPHQVLLVIDATSGQNALVQARIFNEALGITGVVLTKLDGTAKGGVALAIRSELGLPIRYVGLGEKPDDLASFDAEAFASALFSQEEVTDGA